MTFSFPILPPPQVTANQLRGYAMWMRPDYHPAYPLVTGVTFDLDLSVHVYDGAAIDYTCAVNTSESLTRVHAAPGDGNFWLRWESLQPPQRIANWSFTGKQTFNLSATGAGIPGGATDVDVVVTLTGLAKDVAGTLESVGWLGERLVDGDSDCYFVLSILPDVSGVLINTDRVWNQPGDAPAVTAAETWRDGGTSSFTTSDSFAGPGGITEDWTLNDFTVTFDT